VYRTSNTKLVTHPKGRAGIRVGDIYGTGSWGQYLNLGR